ncbi:MAG: 2-oxoacid:acceptor oxidoreductase family protein [Candidatus Eisenbacteria bacterium]|nr:2-oxoacid:acceptor oxidoreductase family protein [Candidatus Eisenbacteria bacterium]MCC7144046.1 2-oxoacid:acceptor oxidoreductase family protein [Candidatus Eisenbacteria bacterium]
MARDTFTKAECLYDRYVRKTKVEPDQVSTHYCPGCGHGNVHKFVAETIDEMGLQDRTIFISPVGCSVFGYYYFHLSNVQAAHGRAPAVATALKRAHPNSIVISYQGDGDLAGIGGNEMLHAANRGEPVTMIFINNAIYGMTGGQMAPTTLLGMKTATTPAGRTARNEGGPIRVVELLSKLDGPVYLERVALTDAKQIYRARAAVRKAIQNQVENRGFSLVEILAPCPTGWKMDPVDARHWIEETMMQVFPLGVTCDRTKEIAPSEAKPVPFVHTDLRALLDIEDESEGFAPNRTHSEGVERGVRLKVAGFGGQGILLLGQGLAECGMGDGYEVSWLPSYGPEMRGGTAHCHVRISERPIGSPLVAESDVLIAMNRPSLERFLPDLVPGGTVLYDSSLIPDGVARSDVRAVAIPATQIANELGSPRTANMVMAGAFARATELFTVDHLKASLPRFVKAKATLAVNETAIDRGAAHMEKLLETVMT